MSFPDVLRFSQLDVIGRRVLLRVDLVAPTERLGSERVLRPLAATIASLTDRHCRVVVLGDTEEPGALPSIARELSQLLQKPVRQLGRDFLRELAELHEGQVALGPNLAQFSEEAKNDVRFATRIARAIDVYVNDAPRASRDVRASTTALPRLVPACGAGPLLGHDLDMTRDFVACPAPPYVALVGGSGVERRAPFLLGLLDRVQALLLGGDLASTFLVARGWSPRRTRYEPEGLAAATSVLEKAAQRGIAVHLPTDGLVLSPRGASSWRRVDELLPDEALVDIGHETWSTYAALMETAETVLWSGTMGDGTPDQPLQGTRVVAEAAASVAYSGVVGEESVALASNFGLNSRFLWLARGGETAAELMAGITPPGVESLRQPEL